MQFSPVRASGGTQILNNKMSINFGFVLDPYALDNNNRKINTFNIDNGGSLFRMTSANMNISYTLSNTTFSGKGLDDKEQQESFQSGGRSDDLFGRPQDFSDQRLTDDDKKDEEKNKKISLVYSKM